MTSHVTNVSVAPPSDVVTNEFLDPKISYRSGAMPEAAEQVRDQRLFLERAVKFLVGEAGIRQILDIGAGMPMSINVKRP